MPRKGKRTRKQLDRENELSRARYARTNGLYFKVRYKQNKVKFAQYYEEKIKPSLSDPDVKAHRNGLQRARRAKAKEERMKLRSSMPFSEYKKLLKQHKEAKVIDLYKTQVNRVIAKIKMHRALRKIRMQSMIRMLNIENMKAA